ncbi:Proliferating cell nuclear antigen, PCNA, C-terminal [Sesbania bispinosa]|nr:Proliferating cell nuclear antigen, PCNA, C-terminal [Sesbania bispinosa]
MTTEDLRGDGSKDDENGEDVDGSRRGLTSGAMFALDQEVIDMKSIRDDEKFLALGTNIEQCLNTNLKRPHDLFDQLLLKNSLVERDWYAQLMFDVLPERNTHKLFVIMFDKIITVFAQDMFGRDGIVVKTGSMVVVSGYHAIVKMPSNEFSRICKDLSSIGDTVTIVVIEEGVKFSTKRDIGTANIVCRQNTTVDKPRGFLFDRDVLAMSFAPKDEHEA